MEQPADAVSPSLVEYLPAAQRRHLERAAFAEVSAYVPAGHSWHLRTLVPAAVGLKRPGSQLVQAIEPIFF